MTFLTKLSLANRAIVGLVTIVIVGFGLFATTSLKQELLPSVQQPGAVVVATFPGASPTSVEREVTEPVERAVRSVKGVDQVTSSTMNGNASIQVQWEFGLDSEKIIADIRSAIEGTRSALPADATTEVYAGSTDDIPVMALAIASEGDPSDFAGQVSSTVLPALREIDGVREVQLSGQNETQLVITMRPADLAAKKVSREEVTAAITASGVVVAAGTSVSDGVALAIEVGSAVTSLDDLKALPIQHQDGPFALSSVADVELVPAAMTSIARADGLPSLSISVLKTPDSNAVEVAHAIRAALPGLERELGHGAAFTVVFDQSPMVEQSIHDLSVEGGLGLLFAVLVILVFLLSLRSTIITAVSIPLSLLIAMIGLWIGDYSLNIFTLAALTVAVGRVVDDSIVVIENLKRRHTGVPMTTASALAAVREVAGAVTASTITTVAVFLPVAFVGGTIGELFRPFAVTVTLALLASLLVSLTIVPVLAYWFMGGRSAKAADEAEAADEADLSPAAPGPVAAGLAATADGVESSRAEAYTRLQRGYVPVLTAALRHPVVSLLVATGIFAGTIVAGGFLKMDYLGSLGEEHSLSITQELPTGTSLDVTSSAAARVEKVLAETEGVESYLTTIGDGSSTSTASITVTLDERASSDEVGAAVMAEVDGLSDVGTVSLGATDAGFSAGGVQVAVRGEDAAAIATGAGAVQEMLAGVPGLGEVTSDLADEQAILKVDVDRAAAARNGFTQAQVGSAISDAVRGASLGSIVLEGSSREVIVRAQRVGATPAEIAALELPVSGLQQAAAQKAAADRLEADQKASAERAEAASLAEVAKQESELRAARTAATNQLGGLTAQLAALASAPVEVPPVVPTTPEEEAIARAYQERAEQLAALDGAMAGARSAVSGIDEQLDAMATARADAAAQRAEAEAFTLAQENLANTTAAPIKVSDVASVANEAAPATITRVDGVRTVTVSAVQEGDDLSAITLAVRDGLDGLELPNGVTATIGGVAQAQEESFAQLGFAMLVAIVLVYIVMVATFRSLLQPLILLVSVPFAATGAVAGLLITGTPLGIPAMIGLLMLIGIVVTNAIVLIDLINSYRARGDSVHDAIVHGSRLRLRPIIMTACATVFALLPMSIGLTGGGVFISQSLAIVVIGGLVSSTLLTLLLVPVLYSLMERRGERRRARRSAKEQETASEATGDRADAADLVDALMADGR
ncbi:efflux RND transporter permease subunit [Agromyces sp. NPDC056379]|uniref:efflux RND transporter permease subunit n=1 Tax=unclassified Agromyces TaxID=2639701 RepID=UPI0035DEB397